MKNALYKTFLVVCAAFSIGVLGRLITLGSGPSSNPTLYGHAVKVSWISSEHKRGDFVDTKSNIFERHFLTKRIIGFPGETIYTPDGCTLYINGEKYEEPYIPEKCSDLMYKAYAGKTWVLGEDEYFLAGDNRNNSGDSRYYGPFKGEQIDNRKMLFMICFPDQEYNYLTIRWGSDASHALVFGKKN